MTPRRLKDVLWVLAIFGMISVGWRLLSGLGPTTDLSDGVPWGIWKVLNMIAGVALATGGFVLAFVVHALGVKSMKPILRPAILVALLGYGSSCFALLMDIGLPDRCWHPFFQWNAHSFLFEVFWCVSLYFTVTVLEFTPIALEESRFPRLRRFLEAISLPAVVLGITLSTMHHSSLGSLFLVSPTRLHPLWYSSLLPVLFIVSAVGAGMMSVVLVTLGISRLYRRPAPLPILTRVASASAVVLSVFLVLRIVDLVARGEVGVAFSGPWEGRLFLVETLLLAVLPIGLIALPRVRRSGPGLAAAGLAAVVGLVLNRMDVGIFGYLRSAGVTYHPTLAELGLTIGIPAAAGLVFLEFVERFRIFTDFGRLEDPAAACGIKDFDPQTKVWRRAFLDGTERVTLIVLLVVPISVGLLMAKADADTEPASPVAPPLAADAARSVLRIDANRSGEFVLFPHEDHKDRLGGEESCTKCHHLDIPNDHFPACWRCHSDMEHSVSIFDHEHHVDAVARNLAKSGTPNLNASCAECHPEGAPHEGETARACAECHEENMRMAPGESAHPDRAVAYADAMHGRCVGCHEESAEETGRPDLPDCATCHK